MEGPVHTDQQAQPPERHVGQAGTAVMHLIPLLPAVLEGRKETRNMTLKLVTIVMMVAAPPPPPILCPDRPRRGMT